MISIVIPTYNRANTILRSINSVLQQTYKCFEIIVVDDGSTDNTKELIEQIVDSRIRYIYLDKNGGASSARNIGVQHAVGEWIAFQDSDDAWKPEKLEKQMKYAVEHPEYNMIYSSFINHRQDGTSSYFPCAPYSATMEGDMYSSLLLRNVIGTPTMLIKRETFLQTGGFDTAYNSLEDWEFVIRFSQTNYIGFLPDFLMDVYIQNNGVSSNVSAYYESRCRMLAEYREDIIKLGIFDSIAREILNNANSVGVQEPVKNMMMLYLQSLPLKKNIL